MRAVILTGAGPAFCGDGSRRNARNQPPSDAHAQWHNDAVIYQDLLLKMLRFPKPLIAAVTGRRWPAARACCWPAMSWSRPRRPPLACPSRCGESLPAWSPALNFRIGGGQSARLLLTAATSMRPNHGGWVFHEVVIPIISGRGP